MVKAQTKDGYLVTMPHSFHGYKFIKVLGAGGSSVVCLIENEKTNKFYLAKIIPKKYIKENNLFEQIKSEISVMKKFDHPNIVKFQESFEFSDGYNGINLAFVMEYCEKGDLCSYMIKNGFENAEQRAKITLGFLKGIKYLHENSISHGDIKLENILLDSEYNAKLADFGFSRIGLTAGDDAKNGTLYYAAPELFFTGNFNPLKSDIWSIGIILYCLSEKSFPFEQNNEKSIVRQITSQKLTFNSGLNKKLRKIVEKCSEKRPENRPCVEEILNDEYFSNYIKYQ